MEFFVLDSPSILFGIPGCQQKSPLFDRQTQEFFTPKGHFWWTAWTWNYRFVAEISGEKSRLVPVSRPVGPLKYDLSWPPDMDICHIGNQKILPWKSLRLLDPLGWDWGMPNCVPFSLGSGVCCTRDWLALFRYWCLVTLEGAEMLKRIKTSHMLELLKPYVSWFLGKTLWEFVFFFKSWDDWWSGSPSHSQFISSTKHNINPVIRSATSKTS